MGSPVLNTDIAIIGGGIAGLWTLNQLRNRGFNAVLFEQGALGSNQTIASQGMIHGGIKYALSGAWSGSSEAISAMPAIWRSCLHGKGKVDLRACNVLSENFYLWSHTGLTSRVSSFFASKMLRGRVEKLSRENYPAPLRSPQFKGQAYRLVDLVLDVPSLVKALADQHQEAIFSIDWSTASLHVEDRQARLQTPDCELRPRQLLLTAGTGNEELVAALGGAEPAMQRRPLQQVLVKHQYSEPFYSHCTGASSSPRLTISSHRTSRGEPVWYLGGELATEGADLPGPELITRARQEMEELMPWIDFGECQWRTLRLDRGEPRQSALLRPDSAFVGAVDSVDNTLVAWPTKLSLSPNLADEIELALAERGIEPGPAVDLAPLHAMGQPAVAETCWDSLFS
ncbi:FAD-dependent oxidoreductase [Pseudohalioglobus lutimaris]|uniref:FAD-dependent oxidoreductase n=1 Tax=Pseudohalioglobus lutimaris TaxID=1737061 RepID=A0A2N5X8J8_9GAMM|nr:FAD-dependent oxidoreductase [Pseudohalioglobus lutimaris]PLW70815.1 FAD-dependent oxidoreductase [Pseudohalioglobus lutimaris]